MKNSKKIKFKTSGGFVLPLAIITVSISLAISLTVSALIMSEIEFSSFTRESQKSFYAADAGIECALYWDLKKMAFSTSTPGTISCADLVDTDMASNISNDVFMFSLNFQNDSCANIVVDKSVLSKTEIRSYGHNSCVTETKRKVERALKVTY